MDIEGLYPDEEMTQGEMGSAVAVFMTAIAFSISALDRIPQEGRTSTTFLAQFERCRTLTEGQERVTEAIRERAARLAALLHRYVDYANRHGWPES